MTKVVLIVIFLQHQTYFPVSMLDEKPRQRQVVQQITMQEFDSRETCNMARTFIEGSVHRNSDLSVNLVSATCVPK